MGHTSLNFWIVAMFENSKFCIAYIAGDKN